MRERAFLPVSLLASLLATPAHADDASFRSWVLQKAREDQAGVSRWGVAQLDDDAAIERYADICTPDTGTVLLEKDASHRWSVSYEVGGRNVCPTSDGSPPWAKKPVKRIDIVDHMGSSEEHDTVVTTIALRNGMPRVVASSIEYDSKADGCGWHGSDFDTLVHEGGHCDSRPRKARGAIFVLDGPSGSYRNRSPSAPTLEVATTKNNRRADVAVTLGRAALVGDSVAFWSTSSAETGMAKAMAWVATWNGRKWTLGRAGAAPRELPEVAGDESHVTVPVLVRAQERTEATPLCIAFDGAGRTEHVATCDLDTRHPISFGLLYTERWSEPPIP